METNYTVGQTLVGTVPVYGFQQAESHQKVVKSDSFWELSREESPLIGVIVNVNDHTISWSETKEFNTMLHRLWLVLTTLSFALMLGISNIVAQGNNQWTAQYYNNTSFSGSPVTASISNLNINWGRNTPASGINADDWTARFNTVAYFNQGTYRFSINADDAFRLYVHGQLLIDTFNNPQPNRTQSIDFNMAAGNAGIQIDFREYIGDAFLYVSWQQLNGGVITIPPVEGGNYGAWSGQYYNNTSFSGSPFAYGSLNNLNVNWGNGAPVAGMTADNWTARFSTTTYFNAGTYRFSVNVDDALRLYVQGRLVLDTIAAPQPDRWLTVDVPMTAGNATIQVDYREYVGPAFIYLSWTQTNTPQQPTTPPIGTNEPQLTVNTGSLNVRSAPYVGQNILTQVARNATYRIIGRTAASDWYQIRVGTTVGWVSARYVIARNTTNVPIANA
jgi:hypothetical protein